jgi:hypothetical protein
MGITAYSNRAMPSKKRSFDEITLGDVKRWESSRQSEEENEEDRTVILTPIVLPQGDLEKRRHFNTGASPHA